MSARYRGFIMKRSLLIASMALASHCHGQALAAEWTMTQSSDSYEAALRNFSTSPSYVQIRVADGETGEARPICTTANFLLGALHREHGLGYGAADARKAVELALNSPGRVFRFQQPSALNNIPVRYSAEDLSAARILLAPFSTAELKEKFSTSHDQTRLPTQGHSKDAIACALIERGLSPRNADITGQVIIPD